MRALLPAVLLLAACGQGAAPVPGSDPAHPAEAPTPVAPDAPKLDAASVTGSWSFDRTCATEDAMSLMPDGKVYFDEWGEGTWIVDPDGRLVLTLRELTPGEDPTASPPFTMTLTPYAPATDDLTGTLISIRATEPPRQINAKRCPAT
jgi:hypothetical protein